MCGDRLREAVEFNQYRSLLNSALIDLRRNPARKEASAGTLQRRTGKFGVSGDSFRVMNGTVNGNPVGFWHGRQDRFVGWGYFDCSGYGTNFPTWAGTESNTNVWYTVDINAIRE